MPWAGVLAPFGVGCNLLLIVMLPFATQLRFGLWLILGIIIYLFMKQRSKGDTNEPA
jgi:ABC-type thiamin/hydroxymethylpyrimidine transport system permease subunit